MLRAIQRSQAGWGIAVLRIVLGLLFFREGAGKMLGWFGGEGLLATCSYFLQLGIPLPYLNAVLVSSVELIGGAALLVGFLTRLAVMPIAMTMVVAVLTAHQQGGWSYPLLIIATCTALFHAGSGPFSLDQRLSKGQ